MANVKISNLPLYTGNTDGGYFVFNNSGETESFKINKSEVFFISNVLQGYRASGTSSDISVVLQPKGDGSFSLQEPDGTTTGGNVRGSKAVDFQMSRTNAAQVASGANSVIIGGTNNTVSGVSSGALGVGHTVSGGNSFANGLQNTITGNQLLVNGAFNNAGGSQSMVNGRLAGNTANYAFSSGFGTVTNGESSVALGERAVSTLRAQISYANGRFADNGDTQGSFITPFRSSSVASAGTLVLTLNGGAELITLVGTNRLWQVNCRFNLVCTVSGGGVDDPIVGDIFAGEQVFTFKKVGGTLTQVGTTSTVHSNADTKLVGTTFTQSVGGSNDLVLTFTVPATTNSNTYRGNATLSITEIGW